MPVTFETNCFVTGYTCSVLGCTLGLIELMYDSISWNLIFNIFNSVIKYMLQICMVQKRALAMYCLDVKRKAARKSLVQGVD